MTDPDRQRPECAAVTEQCHPMRSGVVLLHVQLRDPSQEEAFFAAYDESRQLLEERFRLASADLLVIDRGQYVVSFGFPLPGIWSLVARDRRWQELQAKAPPAEVHVTLSRQWHLDGNPRDISTSELTRWLEERNEGGREFVLVDVLSESSFAVGHVPGAINIPVARFEDPGALSAIGENRDRAVVVYCRDYG